jgi:hypothetical protein
MDNIMIIKHPGPIDTTDNLDVIIKIAPSLYAGFPLVFGKIAMLWGSLLFTKHMNSLVFVDMDSTQLGFPGEVMSELFKLQNAHDKIYNLNDPRDIWDESFDR